MQASSRCASRASLARPSRTKHCPNALAKKIDRSCDLVLSSGFLAFANHSGFLHAVEEAGIHVSGVMGTSAGALAGSLYCAGYSPQQVALELSRVPPIELLQCSLTPWGGLLSMDIVIEKLRDILPPTFEDLEREFAVGVVDTSGRHIIIDSGPLPEAVVASAAIPFVFEPVSIPGHSGSPFKDGGVVDRIGLKGWRDRRRHQLKSLGLPPDHIPHALVHIISKSSPFSGFDNAEATGEQKILVVNSPKSGVNFWNLGNIEEDMHEASARAQPLIRRLLEQQDSVFGDRPLLSRR